MRELTNDDLQEIVYRVKDAANESGWSRVLATDLAHVAGHVAKMISSDDHLVIGSDDVGAILIAKVGNNWYSPSLEANEMIFYVHPEARCTGLAKELISQYVSWAKSKGAKRINIGVNLGIRPDVACALCESLGFKQVGYTFIQDHEE